MKSTDVRLDAPRPHALPLRDMSTMNEAQVPPIALVNNEPVMRGYHARTLLSHGFASAQYDNGHELVADCRFHNFGVIVSDWTNAPKGIDLWHEVQRRGYKGRFVFLSPHDLSIADRFAGEGLRPDAILCPLDPAALLTIEGLISRGLS